jgi:hypothetical protein
VQQVNLEWQAETGSRILVTSPKVDLTTEAVNAYVTFEMPQNRWILFAGGPVLGPAVLFWGYLVVIIIAGVLLGRIKFTPLGTASWILLGLGLTQVSAPVAIMVAGWFIAMGLRKMAVQNQKDWVFNISQVILAIWFIAAMAGIWTSSKAGCLAYLTCRYRETSQQILCSTGCRIVLHPNSRTPGYISSYLFL